MDTYTKQCDCPEIQGLWEPKVGDCITVKSNRPGISFIMLPTHMRPIGMTLKEEYLWLPRQEDIQEMLQPAMISQYWPYTTMGTHPDWNKMKALWLWFEKQSPKDQEMLMSLNVTEFWLAFYMSFHNKRWTKEGWV